MFDFLNVEVLVFVLAASLAITCFSAVCSAPWLVTFSEASGIIRKKVFLDKCAFQTAKLCLFLLLIFIAFALGLILFINEQQPYLLDGPYKLPIIIIAALFGGSLLLSIAHISTWKSLRKNKILHLFLGLLTALSLTAAFFFSGMVLRTLLHSGPALTNQASVQQLIIELYQRIPLSSMLWPMFGQSMLLGFGAIGALSLVWLIARRQRDNFGRDYYNFALPYCAHWAVFGTFGSLIMSALVLYDGWRGMSPALSQVPPTWLMVTGALLPSLACLLWVIIIKSNTPMRHKFGVLLALLFLILSISAQILVANEIMPAS